MRRSILRIALLATFAFFSEAVVSQTWVGSWTSSPIGMPTVGQLGPYTVPPPRMFKGTIRYRLRLSQGGSKIRVKLSNEYGNVPLAVAAVTVGIAGEELNARPGTLKKAYFGSKGSILIPAGAPALTDPLDLPVKALTDLIVTIYLPEETPLFAWSEKGSAADPGIVADIDATQAESLPPHKNLITKPQLLSAISVQTDWPGKVLVALGDSLTSGTVDPLSGDQGWPGVLARRLRDKGISVVNAGIGGNRLVTSMPLLGAAALSRLEQDVFSVPGISHIVLMEGINDIGMSDSYSGYGESPLAKSEDLIAAYSQIVSRAHERGVKVIGATLPPFEGAPYYSEEKEKVRDSVNEWIRTSKVFDAILDFDLALRDSQHPNRLRAEYDPGDHLHPTAAGHRKMGEMIDLKVFD